MCSLLSIDLMLTHWKYHHVLLCEDQNIRSILRVALTASYRGRSSSKTQHWLHTFLICFLEGLLLLSFSPAAHWYQIITKVLLESHLLLSFVLANEAFFGSFEVWQMYALATAEEGFQNVQYCPALWLKLFWWHFFSLTWTYNSKGVCYIFTRMKLHACIFFFYLWKTLIWKARSSLTLCRLLKPLLVWH